jgi:hypothetical protein
MTSYKLLTHDLRPPARGGDPLPLGSLPAGLGIVVPAGNKALGWEMAA